MDKEEGEQLTEAQHVESLLNSEGWKSIYGKLSTRLLDLQNISNLDMTKPETLSIQLASRKMAVDEIWAWLKADVFGFVEAAKTNTGKLAEKTDVFIDRV